MNFLTNDSARIRISFSREDTTFFKMKDIWESSIWKYGYWILKIFNSIKTLK